MKLLIIKNVLIHIFLVPFYFVALNEIIKMPTDKLDTLLLFVGLIVIAPITSNFIYSYKNSEDQKSLVWGHITTFFSMLVVGMLFVILDILLVLMIGNVFVFRSAILIFWVAVITFDFADFLIMDARR
ncbi:MAG: hypothetical protein OEV93_00065 [Candidatus Moranbacteria bacterium]|nr:hypothetical protein [Candidatus Moranbacteria bacterium]